MVLEWAFDKKVKLSGKMVAKLQICGRSRKVSIKKNGTGMDI